MQFDTDALTFENGVMVSDIISLLRPTIEAYLQSKHFGAADGAPLIIDLPDLVTH